MSKILLFTSLILLTCYGFQTFAAQTQVNKVTDLFDQHIEDKDALLQNLKGQNDNAMGQIKSKNHHESIEGINEAEGKAGELNSINENDLDNAGRQKRISKEYQFYDENELEPDYTKPGNKMHKLDSQDIVTTTEKTMRKIGTDLIKRLIELGFNCKTVKGAIYKEPTYYIDIRRKDQKNTEYDQFFCEEPRNQYNCNDNLTLSCQISGIQWGPWQDKHIRIPGGELVNSGKDVFWVDKTGKRCYEYKLTLQPVHINLWGTDCGWQQPEPHKIHLMREFLTTKHPGSTIDNISTEMNSSWEGGIFSIDGWTYGGRVLGSKDYAWSVYVVNYKYRDGSLACFQWSEDWTERCMLK